MSVTAKDHRRFIEGAEHKPAVQAPSQMLPQEHSEIVVADEHLNKLIRVLQASIEAGQVHLDEVAHAGALALNVEQKQKMTIEYAFTKGMLEAYKAMQLIPAKILDEETPRHSA